MATLEKQDFENGIALAEGKVPEGDGRSYAEILEDWLYNVIVFEPEYDSEYEGCFVHQDRWLAPEAEEVLEWLEWSQDSSEFRLAKYEKDGKLSIAEQKAFKDYVIESCVDNGDYPGVFLGVLSHKKQCLYVYTTRSGYSFEGIEIDILGLFKSKEEAEKALFADGELH